MKKYLLVLVVLVVISPSIALASWWNPFSWFSSKIHVGNNENTTQVVEKKSENNLSSTSPILIEISNKTSTTSATTKISPKIVTKPKTIVNQTIKVTVPQVKTFTLSNGAVVDENGNLITPPAKTDQQKCDDSFGLNSIDTGEKNNNGGPICSCQTGYIWNSDQTSCVVKIVKTGYQICSDAYPNETWNGTYSDTGKYNCVCKAGYIWDSNQICQLSQTDNIISPPPQPPAPTLVVPSVNQEQLQLNKVCWGVNKDIRDEITKSGGFATESQVEALVIKRMTGLGCFNLPPPYQIPTAMCLDWTYSYSQNRSGTCSDHGGVASWFPY